MIRKKPRIVVSPKGKEGDFQEGCFWDRSVTSRIKVSLVGEEMWFLNLNSTKRISENFPIQQSELVFILFCFINLNVFSFWLVTYYLVLKPFYI